MHDRDVYSACIVYYHSISTGSWAADEKAMDLNADVADWLSENGLELDDFLPLLRENMVENLEDLLFLASDDEDLEAMGLNPIQVMELMFALSGAISERDQLANRDERRQVLNLLLPPRPRCGRCRPSSC